MMMSAEEEEEEDPYDADGYDFEHYKSVPMEKWTPLRAEDKSYTVAEGGSQDMSEAQLGKMAAAAAHDANLSQQLQELEQEQEQLTNNLMALTSHFAQVQLRLKQIANAETAEEKDAMMKELEEFAFRGIPDTENVEQCLSTTSEMLTSARLRFPDVSPETENKRKNGRLTNKSSSSPPLRSLSAGSGSGLTTAEHEEVIAAQREKQTELIKQLKNQLQDLELYAYQSGDSVELPSLMALEKQKVIISELKSKMDLNVDNMDRMDEEELKKQVDHAVCQITNPAKVKEQLVEQLKTQIVDLERYIGFLQTDQESVSTRDKKQGKVSNVMGSRGKSGKVSVAAGGEASKPKINTKDLPTSHAASRVRELTRRAIAILHVMTATTLICGSREPFRKNELKTTPKGNHYGDVRARLELAIDKVLALIKVQEQETQNDSDYTSDSEESPTPKYEEELVQLVRKELAMSLKDLMQHGLMVLGQSRQLVPLFGCFPRSAAADAALLFGTGGGVGARAVGSGGGDEPILLHPWEFVLKYYESKGGHQYNDSPLRKLSDSFRLDNIGGTPITPKQTLLGAIGTVLNTHKPHKRSEDAHFKAFVSRALNEKKLVVWLRLIFKGKDLVEHYYQPWSYVSKTGFEDALKSLDRLKSHNFNLPTNLAVKQLENIRDAF